jgi:hypothetical protein
VATASNTSQNASEGLSGALDGDAATRWESGAAMASGMWFQLDMGFPRKFDQIVMDANGAGTDFPLKYKVYATNDTASLGDPIATGDGAEVTVIRLATPATGQFIRIVCQEGQGGSWWSIFEINVRCVSLVKTRFTETSREKAAFRIDAFFQKRSVLVNYKVPQRGWVTVEELSLNGSRIGVLVDGFREAGNYFVSCNMDHGTSKMVLFKINYKGFSKLQRAVLIK